MPQINKPLLPGLLLPPRLPAAKPAPRVKRATLPLEDKLVLAELRDLMVGKSEDSLERIAVALERIADALRILGIEKQIANDGRKWNRTDVDDIPF